jgi:predicted nucleotidyltransferase
MTIRKTQVLKLIADHREELERFDVQALYLFGSVARDEATESSDVDIEVEFASTPNFDRYIDLKFYLEDLLQTSVDLLTKSSIRPEIAPYIEKEAIRAA